jgi:hypothetical protein
MRELGSTGNMWGNIYPRSGFVTQTDSYKSAAVVVQRVADIITRRGQLHVYNPLVGNASPGYWPPDPVKENTGTTNHKWQRLSPQVSQSCAVFPDTNGQIVEDGNYVWALWQPYSCCKRRGQTFPLQHRLFLRLLKMNQKLTLRALMTGAFIFAVSMPAMAVDTNVSSSGASASGAINDGLFYSIGGGTVISPPASRNRMARIGLDGDGVVTSCAAISTSNNCGEPAEWRDQRV